MRISATNTTEQARRDDFAANLAARERNQRDVESRNALARITSRSA